MLARRTERGSRGGGQRGGRAVFVCLLAVSLGLVPMLTLVPPPPNDMVPVEEARAALSAMARTGPVGFVENVGQLRNPDIRFYTSVGGLVAGFGVGGIEFHVPGNDAAPDATFHLRFSGSTFAKPVGLGESTERSHFFLGSSASEWRTDVRSYSEVFYSEVYPGIDLRYRIGSSGLKYEFFVAAGVDARRIELQYAGLDGLLLDGDGGLILVSAGRQVRDSAPIAFQGDDRVPCHFERRGTWSVGIACPEADPARPLVIDPLLYCSYLGGRFSDGGWSVAVDSQGFVYVAGLTESPDFPTTNVSFGFGGHGFSDAFVMKLDPTGHEIVYSTYLGGTSRDSAVAVAVDADGNAYVAGLTRSANFPTTDGVFDRSLDGPADVFVAKLSPLGDHLLFSVLVGGSGTETAGGIAVDAHGSVYVSGRTQSEDFPTSTGITGPPLTLLFPQAFVVKIDGTGGYLLYSTVLGAERWDEAFSIALDVQGNAYITGQTSSENFTATPGAFDRTINGFEDAFVAKLDPAGSLVYATFLGGADGDVATSIAVDASGNALVAGVTESPDFPTTAGATQTSLDGLSDAFVMELNANGSDLVYSTFLGGGGRDEGEEITIDAAGDAYVTGLTTSSDFPTTPGAFDREFGISPGILDEGDGFVARLHVGTGTLVYGSYLGGRGSDLARDIALDPAGNAWVTGFTLSDDFPTTSKAIDATWNGSPDAYVARLRLEPGNGSPWLAEATDGSGAPSDLQPRIGTTATAFTYSVVYGDPDNDPPLAGFPAVHVFQDGLEIAGSPFAMQAADGGDANYADGKTYRASMTFPEQGNYSYLFSAYDVRGNAAANSPSPPRSGPQMTIDVPAPEPSGPWLEFVAVVLTLAASPVVAFIAIRRGLRGRLQQKP